VEISKYFDRAVELKDNKQAFVTVSITGLKGSAPQDLGAKMIVTDSGLDFGTVGGGKVEAHCIKYAQELISTDKLAASETWNLQRDIGMTCGGEVSFFFEVSRAENPWEIAVFGAGHISQELCRLLIKLDCHVTVIDNRREWLDKLPEHKNLFKIHNVEMKEVLKDLSPNTYVAMMTMGHAYDVPILNEALSKHNFPYLAVIGSKSKRNRMEAELKEMGLTENRIKNFICPIGEDFGSNHPVEIAVSITGQLLRFRDKS
jgi:xanthine dehydrogenase accessory factor